MVDGKSLAQPPSSDSIVKMNRKSGKRKTEEDLPPTPPKLLAAMALAVGTHSSLWLWLLWRAVKMLRERARAGTLQRRVILGLPIAAFGGTLFTDTIAYFTHFFLDNYLSENGILGYMVRIFEIHHENPRMDEQNYLENAWAESLFGTGILATAFGCGALNLRSVLSCTYFAFVGFWAGQISAVHKAAHQAAPALFYKVLQKMRITVDRAYHGKHHTKFASHYSLCTGHFEAMFDACYGVPLLESILFLSVGKVSRHSILGLKLEQEKLQPNLAQRFQQVKYLLWYKLFNSLMVKLRLQLHFMNWGYRKADNTDYQVPDGGDVVLGSDPLIRVVNGTSLQLYMHMLQGIDIKGKDVVEVSSGRGGFLASLAASGQVNTCVGVDTCAVAVDTCNTIHEKLFKVRYQQGDAMGALGVEADVLVNVEASHCYPSREMFFKNVFNTLRPGGVFLFADFMGKSEVPQCVTWLEAAGFSVEVQEDITAGVLRGMELTNEAKVTLIRERLPRFLWGVMERFAATEGSVSRGDTTDGWRDAVYLHVRCRKPAL